MSEIKEFLMECIENIDKIDDIVDKAIEPATDYIDTISELIKPINTMRKVFTLAKRNRIKKFAIEYAKKVNENEFIDGIAKRKFEVYMTKEVNKEFFGEIIDSAINSNSYKCSAILGYYAGKFLNELITVEYKDMIIVNALRCMNDYDLKFFYDLYQYIINDNLCEDMIGELRIFLLKKEDELKLGFNTLIIGQKLKSLQIISSDENEIMPGCNAIFVGVITEVSDYLFNIIKESQVELEI